METRTRFDLKAAIQGWREQVASQPGISAESRRELETHLTDSIAGLRERGLNDKEAFWLARRRVGNPQELGEEFARENPATVWRERVLWVALGICVMHLWSAAPIWSAAPMYLLQWLFDGIVAVFAHNFYLPDWVLFYVPLRTQWLVEHVLRNPIFVTLFYFIPLIILLGLLARGGMDRAVSKLRFLVQSRRRFALVAAAVVVIYYAWGTFGFLRSAARAIPGALGPDNIPLAILIQNGLLRWVASGICSLMLVALVAWLMPSRPARAKERDESFGHGGMGEDCSA